MIWFNSYLLCGLADGCGELVNMLSASSAFGTSRNANHLPRPHFSQVLCTWNVAMLTDFAQLWIWNALELFIKIRTSTSRGGNWNQFSVGCIFVAHIHINVGLRSRTYGCGSRSQMIIFNIMEHSNCIFTFHICYDYVYLKFKTKRKIKKNEFLYRNTKHFL